MRSWTGPSKDRRKLSICSFGGARELKAHAVGRFARSPGHRRRSAGLVGEAVGSETDRDELALLQREQDADLAAPQGNVLGHAALEPAPRAELDGDPYLAATVLTRVVSGHGRHDGGVRAAVQREKSRSEEVGQPRARFAQAGRAPGKGPQRVARKGTASPAPTGSAIASLAEWPVESTIRVDGLAEHKPGSSTVTSSDASLTAPSRSEKNGSKMRSAAARGAQCTRSQADRHGVPGSGSSSATWGRWSLAGRRPERSPLG